MQFWSTNLRGINQNATYRLTLMPTERKSVISSSIKRQTTDELLPVTLLTLLGLVFWIPLRACPAMIAFPESPVCNFCTPHECRLPTPLLPLRNILRYSAFFAVARRPGAVLSSVIDVPLASMSAAHRAAPTGIKEMSVVPRGRFT